MSSVDASYKWDGAELDLPAYLSRIGYRGTQEPTVATLAALHRAHTTSIPFENLELMLGRPILLDLASIQAKIVGQRRGGYCYENVALFAAALERMGFGITGLHARVMVGATGLRPATHAVLRVTTADDDRVWLCDVGFGRGPLEPLELTPGEVDQDGWRFRLTRTAGPSGVDEWATFHYGPDGWSDRHRFTLNPQYRLDYAVGNHYVSTSPRSPFLARPYIQRFRPDVHHVVDGHVWTIRDPLGLLETRELEPAELPKILAEYFDIELDDADAATIAGAPWLTRNDR